MLFLSHTKAIMENSVGKKNSMENLYYKAPSDEAFEEMKKAAIEVWGQYADSPGGYMEEKVSRIEGIQNVQDNFMYMLAMFDQDNQRKVIALLSEPTKDAVRERMVAGGNPSFVLEMIGL